MNSNHSGSTGLRPALRPAPHLAQRPSRRLARRVAGATTLAAVLGVALVGCGGQDKDSGSSAGQVAAQSKPGSGGNGTKVLWVGDSITGAEAPALAAALKAGGVEFKDASSDGGGTVVDGGDEITGKISEDTWKQLAANIGSFKPTVIAYQVTTYDWGSEDKQRAAYDKLAKTAKDAGAKLVLVTAPPIKIDDFYKKYEPQMRTAPKAAEAAAKNSDGAAVFLDSAQLWGTDAAGKKAQRSSDGIHNCQQGAAAFAKWLTEQLGGEAGFTPAPVDAWAQGEWTGDARYGNLKCGS
ncbi:SGNH hydrolase domain-containing protein [Streptomyces sp. NPDC006711]|uniref:SGNH hydrolase domain-containing protein n=1 Tax=Streptomyces sp. NPDC006711 TaxID=3364762 RepID=UPI0036D06F2B